MSEVRLIAGRVEVDLIEAAGAAVGLPGQVTATQIVRYSVALAAGLPRDIARGVACGVDPGVMAGLMPTADGVTSQAARDQLAALQARRRSDRERKARQRKGLRDANSLPPTDAEVATVESVTPRPQPDPFDAFLEARAARGDAVARDLLVKRGVVVDCGS